MLLQILKSKLKQVIVTDANTEYEGSLTLDPDLMDAARLRPFERVEVNSVDSEARIVTYIIEGKRGSGQVEMNGGAANFFKPSDRIHVNCFMFVEQPIHLDRNDPSEGTVDGWWKSFYSNYSYPFIVHTDENNKVTEVK